MMFASDESTNVPPIRLTFGGMGTGFFPIVYINIHVLGIFAIIVIDGET
jgi:hypothetical protein